MTIYYLQSLGVFCASIYLILKASLCDKIYAHPHYIPLHLHGHREILLTPHLSKTLTPSDTEPLILDPSVTHIHRLSSLYIHLELLGIAVTCDFCPVPSSTPTEAPHVQYERLGSNVTLPCGTANWDAAVTWLVNGTDLASDMLNGS